MRPSLCSTDDHHRGRGGGRGEKPSYTLTLLPFFLGNKRGGEKGKKKGKKKKKGLSACLSLIERGKGEKGKKKKKSPPTPLFSGTFGVRAKRGRRREKLPSGYYPLLEPAWQKGEERGKKKKGGKKGIFPSLIHDEKPHRG